MSWGRFVSALFAVVAVAGCAVIALGMSRDGSSRARHERVAAYVAPTTRPAYLPLTLGPAATRVPATVAPLTTAARPVPIVAPTSLHASAQPLSGSSTSVPVLPATPARTASVVAPVGHSVVAPRTRSTSAPPVRPSRSQRLSAPPSTSAPTTPAAPTSSPRRRTVSHPRTRSVAQIGGKLPLPFRTHNARQVITVVARSSGSTTATLQAWRKTRTGGWLRRGPRIKAWVGAQGLTRHASESKSATPIGSFTLTHAFGHDSDPGTALPYLHTNPSDWWISQLGRLYNTHQRCSSNCPFRQGDPNEHLYYETPYYNYAVVIDYNTRNAPGGVRQGAGSAFFLHVHPAGTGPTSGCVAIPRRRLVPIMRWLRPHRHPRILIGVS